ncbi:MAG: aconitate hydratase [Planctomycetaceae bacterium]|nr:aconitate hydratase [Planctomycetaceae bacterium]
MPKTLTAKILQDHLVTGKLMPGSEIGLRIDQTLTQDATGTTAFLLLEAMDIPRVRAELAVSYVDHNMAQFGPENHNDHLYLQSIAAKIGAYFSRPGNGICHQVHLERFGRPGKTLLGSDSHTPTGGGLGMLAIGAGGLDVAVAMGGGAFYTPCPRVIGVELRGKLPPWVAAKDIILRLLSILTTRGNVNCIVEYFGEGVASLPVPARATCTNMGAELGVTTSVFPSDDLTRQFLTAQGRGEHYAPLAADEGAKYDRIQKHLHLERDAATIQNIQRFCTGVAVDEADTSGVAPVSFGGIVIDLDELEPLAAGSPSPDNILTIASLVGKPVRQVLIGSCTNSSFQDLTMAAALLKGRTVHPLVELGIAPGSRQVLTMLAESGALASLIAAGARILESACGPCIGLGFSPAEGAVSVRTFNRNFTGRTGTSNDEVYLVSPETAVAAAITGCLTDPRELPKVAGAALPAVQPPEKFRIDDGMIVPPAAPGEAAAVEVIRGSTIVKPPSGQPLGNSMESVVLIKVGDKITTDHIMPAGALLKHRSNVPEYAKYVFNCFNKAPEQTFAQRALAAKERNFGGIIVAGASYGQGSSREHAALCPMYLGVRVVIAKSIERIHQANLVNFGILPLTFAAEAAYDAIAVGDKLIVEGLDQAIALLESITIHNRTRNADIICRVTLAARQRKILAAGGLLNYTRQGGQ